MELHGARCDAQSCTVAATGDVLIPATGAQEEDYRSGQRVFPGHRTHRETGRFSRGAVFPLSPAMASTDRSTGAREFFFFYANRAKAFM